MILGLISLTVMIPPYLHVPLDALVDNSDTIFVPISFRREDQWGNKDSFRQTNQGEEHQIVLSGIHPVNVAGQAKGGCHYQEEKGSTC